MLTNALIITTLLCVACIIYVLINMGLDREVSTIPVCVGGATAGIALVLVIAVAGKYLLFTAI